MLVSFVHSLYLRSSLYSSHCNLKPPYHRQNQPRGVSQPTASVPRPTPCAVTMTRSDLVEPNDPFEEINVGNLNQASVYTLSTLDRPPESSRGSAGRTAARGGGGSRLRPCQGCRFRRVKCERYPGAPESADCTKCAAKVSAIGEAGQASGGWGASTQVTDVHSGGLVYRELCACLCLPRQKGGQAIGLVLSSLQQTPHCSIVADAEPWYQSYLRRTRSKKYVSIYQIFPQIPCRWANSGGAPRQVQGCLPSSSSMERAQLQPSSVSTRLNSSEMQGSLVANLLDCRGSSAYSFRPES